MSKLLTWSFIPMFFRRLIHKGQQEEIGKLDIIARLKKEVFLSKHIDLNRYGIRKASTVQVSMFSDNLVDFNEWVNIALSTMEGKEYVPDKWKVIKRPYGSLMLDEYFSVDGYDIDPRDLVTRLMPKLIKICDLIPDGDTREDKTRRVYYLRHFKPIFEDGIELMFSLRTMLL